MRKRTRRKVWALVNPLEHAISGATMTSEADLDRLRIRELAAIDAFAHGRAGLVEWRDLTQMLNLAEQMARMGIGPEVLVDCASAEAHLIDAKERFERIGRMGATGPALQAFRGLYEAHDLQRTSVDRSTYERAIQKTADMIRSKAPGVTEL